MQSTQLCTTDGIYHIMIERIALKPTEEAQQLAELQAGTAMARTISRRSILIQEKLPSIRKRGTNLMPKSVGCNWGVGYQDY